MTYFDELKKAMNWLKDQPNTIFLGQAVAYKGTAMTNTLTDVPESQKLELPVAEEMQLGMSYGLALQGFTPISIFPRWNFLLLAINQLINHIDKYPMVSDFKGKVIIRTGIGSVYPLDPQRQHRGDYCKAVQSMLKTVEVVRLDHPENIVDEYLKAFERKTSTILCEVSDFYNEDFRLKHGDTYFDRYEDVNYTNSETDLTKHLF